MKILLPIALIITLGSCAGGWTDDDKKQLRESCVTQARGQISEAQTEKYCNCFVEQMVTTFPVFNDAMAHAQSDTVEKLKARCRQEIGVH